MNDLWALPNDDEKWRLLEECFSLPTEKRAAWLIEQANKKSIQHLGSTDKTAPEIATELIKTGIMAKSYVKGKPNAKSNG